MRGKLVYSCLLKVPIFKHLSEAEMAHVHEFIRPKSYKKGEYIQLAGDVSSELLVLNRGSAKVSRTSSDGNEVLIRSLAPGDYIGDTAVFGNVPADNDTVATTDVSFCTLSGNDLHSLLRKYPELSIKIAADLSLRLKKAEAQIESLSLKKADDRLLSVLHDYADGRSTFVLNLSKKDLASQIGMRPETLSRSLKQLEQKGLIKIEGSLVKLEIDNP